MLAALGLSCWVRAFSSCGAQAFHCGGFSGCRSGALELRLTSYGTWAQLLCIIWNLPIPGTEPTSPALAQADPSPLDHQGSPRQIFLIEEFQIIYLDATSQWLRLPSLRSHVDMSCTPQRMWREGHLTWEVTAPKIHNPSLGVMN